MPAITRTTKATSSGSFETNTRGHADTEVNPVELDHCWERLNQHHQAVGEAFLHTVICGVEIVRLKRLIRHGGFSIQAKKHVPTLAPRTIRRYRQIGEWYLSASHGRVVTVSILREDDSEPEGDLCRDEAIAEYLHTSQIQNADQLQEKAFEQVPELKEPRGASKGSRVENLMQKVRRAWSRMSPDQKSEFVRCFEEFRSKPAKEKPPQNLGNQKTDSDREDQDGSDDAGLAA